MVWDRGLDWEEVQEGLADFCGGHEEGGKRRKEERKDLNTNGHEYGTNRHENRRGIWMRVGEGEREENI